MTTTWSDVITRSGFSAISFSSMANGLRSSPVSDSFESLLEQEKRISERRNRLKIVQIKNLDFIVCYS